MLNPTSKFLLLTFFAAFIFLSGCDPNPGSFSVNPKTHDFNRVDVDSDNDVDFIIKNKGSLRLLISNIQIINLGKDTIAGEFSVIQGWNNTPISILGGKTHTLTIRFHPTNAKQKCADLVVSHSGRKSPYVMPLNGFAHLLNLVINSSDQVYRWDSINHEIKSMNVYCGPYIADGIAYDDNALYTIADYTGNSSGVLKINLNPSGTTFLSSTMPLDSTQGSNPKGITVISPTKAYAINGGKVLINGADKWAVTEFNPFSNTPLFRNVIEMPEPAPGNHWSPEGCTAFENRLFVVCTGFNPVTYGYCEGAIFVLNTENNLWIDADPTTSAIDPIKTQTINPRFATIAPNGKLYVICNGDYFSVNSAVEVFDPRTFESVCAPIDLGFTTGVGKPAIDADDRLYIPISWYTDTVGGKFYSVDTRTNTILRDYTDLLEIPGNVSGANFGVMACAISTKDQRMYFANFNANQLYEVDLTEDTNSGQIDPTAYTEITNVAGGSSFGIPLLYEDSQDAKFADTVVSYNIAGGSYNDPQKALGPAEGTGSSTGSLDVVSVESTKSLVLEILNYDVIDGPGWDFVIFENAFYTNYGKPTDVVSGAWRWIEPAEVLVSEDGVQWLGFQTSENTNFNTSHVNHWVGSWAGISPVFTSSTTGIKPLSWCAGGDKFDLHDIGVAKARYIKIIGYQPDPSSPDIDAMAYRNYAKR